VKTLCSLLLSAGSAFAADVQVHFAEGNLPPAIAQSAKAQVSWMFARIGVRIQWRGTPAGSPLVRIEVSVGAAPQFHPGALAYARPFETGVRTIVVFYDRIVFAAARWPGFEHRLLAHVLAHEIGHVLSGTDAHSEAGVMKAHWTPADYAKMATAPLPFTDAVIPAAGRP
jgi:hypothetical protein